MYASESQSSGIISHRRRIFSEIFLDPMPLREYSDYDDYWDQRGFQSLKFRVFWIAQHLPEQGTLLDVGCGGGAFLEYVRSQKLNLQVRDMDGSASAIGRLREKV